MGEVERRLPPIEVLRELLFYDPSTGRFKWKFRSRNWFSRDVDFKKWNARRAGKFALISVGEKGRRKGFMFGKLIYAHRAAWAIHFGEWPKGEIDHINGDASDNRIINLRVVNRTENWVIIPFGQVNLSTHRSAVI